MSFPISLAMILRSISLFKCSQRASSDSKPVCFESTNRVAVYKLTRVESCSGVRFQQGVYGCICPLLLWRCGPTQPTASLLLRFLNHTQRRTTVGRTPLDEWSARRRNLYLTARNTHNRQTSMPPVCFEPTISAGERPQTYTLRPRGHWDRSIDV